MTLAISLVSLGPFLLQPNASAQIEQMVSRLFPFKRGIVHMDVPASNYWILVVEYMRYFGGWSGEKEWFVGQTSNFDFKNQEEGFKKWSIILTGQLIMVSRFSA